ncbi:MAG TPA: heme exporter protein CcmB [Longimicrobiaceae bacterium]
MGRFLGQVLVVARKDLVLELRSRERLVLSGTFAVLVALVFSFSLDPTLRARDFAAAMIWVTVLFAGILGLGRSFAMEREQEALSGMLLAPVERGVLFLGKFLANLAILLSVELVIFPVYALFFGLAFAGSLWGIALIVFLASVGFMLLGTLFAAVSAHTRLGEMMLPVLLIPLLLPVVIFAVSGTQRLMAGRPFEEVMGNLRMLLAFDLVYLFVCTVIFGSVVEE